MTPRLLVIQTGTTVPAVRERHGDYPDWFVRALGADAERMPILRAHEGERLDRAALQRHGAGGIIVTGSPLSVTERAPWMEELGRTLLDLGAAGTPILGVCFGHQLLCRAAGGDVVRNPRGREIGTVAVQLTEAGRRDPLFSWAGGAERIEVQATHVDAVDPLPPGVTVLAGNENTPAQAVRFSETVAAVQFHPELAPEAMKALIASRAERLREEGLDAQALSANVRDTQAAGILRAFAEQVKKA